MLTRKFIYKKDEAYGVLGWAPAWMLGANVVSQQGFAHDILEHHPNMELGAEAEFHALGSMWWLRGETGWFSGRGMYTDEESFAFEFPTILERISQGIETLHPTANSRPLSQLHYGATDEILRSVVRSGIRQAKSEAKERDDTLDVPHDADQRILNWMRRGYRYAVARYGMGRNFDMEWLFNQIENECEKAGKHADVGMEMIVSINLKALTVRAEADYPRENGYY